MSINQLANTFRQVVSQVTSIADGNYATKVSLLGQSDELGTALYKMTKTLQAVSQENKSQQWIKSAQMQLLEILHVEQNIESLSNRVIRFLTQYIGAEVGVMYVLDKQKNLRLSGCMPIQYQKSNTL